MVRGYYDGLDSASLSKLAQDIVIIMLEKNKHSRTDLEDMKPLLPLMGIVILVAVTGVIWFSRKPKEKNQAA